jgi:antibiotic biosynthesis monooxygenase (ABM) superfamily enzyme
VTTHTTAIPLPLAIMDANIALSDLASCGTHRIRAKLVRRVHRLVRCFFHKHIMPMAVAIFKLLPPFHQLVGLYPSAYLASLIIILILNAFLHGWPLLITNGIVTVCLAFLLTYVGLPLSTRLLHAWLYPQER